MTMPFLPEMLSAFPVAEGEPDLQSVAVSGQGDLPSWFDVTGLATASIAAAGLMLARIAGASSDAAPRIAVDRRLASFWFGMTIRPQGWDLPPIWDAIAGDYRAGDGWIRLHTNAPHHRAAALSVLGDYSERAALAPAVAKWDADDLETAVVAAGGCAAAMRDLDSWSRHPQGVAVSAEPLILWQKHRPAAPGRRDIVRGRPLAGIKVLDLTRVLAGPVAGRFLAAYGATVLRIDPPDWDEPSLVPEVTLGKRCAGLNLKDRDDRAVFEGLLADADVLLHGYRPEALVNLGYGADKLRRFNPRLIDVCLDAYGWSGPWKARRGFDSLVQMSSGIADFGMKMSGADKPTPLPVQALDHATGYLLAAAVLHALHENTVSGQVISARLSLARMAHLLSASKRSRITEEPVAETAADFSPQTEQTAWGAARRIKFPIKITGVAHSWDYPAGKLRSAAAAW